MKRDTGMEEKLYNTKYPTGCTPPKFYGFPKLQKTGTPLDLLYQARAQSLYGVAKVLAKILRLLVGKSPHHIQSNEDFVNKISKVTLLPGECLCSYDVSALFTSVPIDPALRILKELLEQDTSL